VRDTFIDVTSRVAKETTTTTTLILSVNTAFNIEDFVFPRRITPSSPLLSSPLLSSPLLETQHNNNNNNNNTTIFHAKEDTESNTTKVQSLRKGGNDDLTSSVNTA
jgi:hypothetical protein